MNEQQQEATAPVSPRQSGRRRPSQAVPTDRISFSKQLDLLRAYAALSGVDRRAVSLSDVGQTTGMTAATASLANAFFLEAGFLAKHDPPRAAEAGGAPGFLPTQVTIDYYQSYEWKEDTAAHKLASALRESWGWEAIEGRLRYAEAKEQEVVRLLAEASEASPHYEPQLKTMIAYFESAGLVDRDGQSIRLVRREQTQAAPQPERLGMEADPHDEPPPTPTGTRAGMGEPVSGLADMSMVHPALIGLLQLLPEPRTPWESGKPDWIRAFTAAIDAIYPDIVTEQREVVE